MDESVACLCLGSNLGNRKDNLNRALALLAQKLKLDKVSSIYDTEPVDNVNQPRFLNLVCRVYTNLTPKELLVLAKNIENKLGRAPSKERYGPRPIDIDILFYDEQVMDTPELTIPHRRLAERAFVLIPLAEIAPDLKHPLIGKAVKQLLKEVKGKEGVVRWEE